MADGSKDSSDPASPRRRPAATIDLKATEIASDPVKPAEPSQAADSTTYSSDPEPQPAAAPPQPEARPSRAFGPLVGGGLAGAVVTVGVLAALWALGLFGAHDEQGAASAARLASLEQQVRELAARPQPVGIDQRVLADLASRVGAAEHAVGRLAGMETALAKLEATASTPRAAATDQALADRVTAVETATRALGDLRQRVDAASEAARKNATPATAPGELAALAARVATLEQAEKAIEQRVTRTPSGDPAGRVAFVAVALRAAVERGDPFAQELSSAKTLAPNAAVLAPLEPYAASGVPRPVTLARELSQIATPILNAAGTPREGGILDRLQQNAERLVRIRPINEGVGDDPSTIVARAEVKATHGDIPGALAELARLPDAARAPAQDWIRKAEMQVAALAAARRFAETSVDALAKAER